MAVAATLVAVSFSLTRRGCMCRHGSRRDLTGRWAFLPAGHRHRRRSMQRARQWPTPLVWRWRRLQVRVPLMRGTLRLSWVLPKGGTLWILRMRLWVGSL